MDVQSDGGRVRRKASERTRGHEDFVAHAADVDDACAVAAAFDEAKAIEAREGRAYLPPFESEAMALGAATLGMEFLIQTGQLDALFVAIGALSMAIAAWLSMLWFGRVL
jgi:threonine dehydratase